MHTAESLQKAFKYLFEDEVTALKDLARSLPDNPVVVNIGAGAGTSSLAFLESRLDLFLYCIDIQLDDSPFGSLAAEEKVLNEAGFNKRYYQVWGDSKIVGSTWIEQFAQAKKLRPDIWLVLIDGDHSYRGAKGDILAWLPNIKEGGIVAVHDFGKKEVYRNGPIDNAPHPLPWPGVDRAVRKFLCPFFEKIAHVDTLIAFRINERSYSQLMESIRYNMAHPYTE